MSLSKFPEYDAMMKLSRLSDLALAAVLTAGFGMAATAPAMAQDGLLMRNIFGKIGILPEEKDPIDYNERPALIVPKDAAKLRPPEEAGAHSKNAQWPVDPDVQERKRELARRNASVITPLKSDPSEGGLLSLDELAKGRSARGAKMGESVSPNNDKAGVRMSPDEWSVQSKQANAPSYVPGTEPSRRYLTDPPKGLRVYSSDAPIARTTEAPLTTGRADRPDSAWKRLD